MRTPSRVALLLVGVLGMLLSCVTPAVADIFYVYDDLGRLIAVIDPASDTAVYSYDAVGNLLAITRRSSAQVSIIDFKPKSGPVGTSVAIQGTGFSATPSQNTVTFNGTAATVTSASTTELVATVPAGASTGPIGVAAPGGSATSSASFTVTSTSGAPTITSFTPTIGAPGDAITVNGTNFDPTPLNNKLGFNATHPRLGRVTAATATTLTVTVPPEATSGRLRVATDAGVAESTADFFAPPAPYTAAHVVFTGRIVAGGASLNVTIGTAGRIGLVVFDGTAGQRLSLGITNSSFNGGAVVYRPDGTLFVPQGSLDFPPLPVAGTYTIQLGNSFSGTGSLTLTLSEEVTGTITIGGPSVSVGIWRPMQRARLTFQGTAGQRLNLRGGSSMIPDGVVSVLTPAEATLGAGGLNFGGAEVHPPVLPVTGTYQVLVDPSGGNTGSVLLTLSEEVGGTISVGGASVSVSLSRVGQRARLTFEGTAGQRLSVGVTGSTVPITNLSILAPGGGTVVSGGSGAPSGAMDSPPLPVTGAYALLADPNDDYTGSLTLTLSEEVTGTITVNGPSVTVSIPRAGQRARLSFSGTAGQRLSLGLTASTITSGTASVLNPDGTTLMFPGGFGTTPTALEVPVLPTSGTYSLVVDPTGVATGSITLTLSEEVTGTITPGGPAVTVSITRPGQRARLSFPGTAGQRVSVVGGSGTISQSSVTLYTPQGSQLGASGAFPATGGFLDTRTLASTGTYALLLDPDLAYTGDKTVTLHDVPPDATGTLTINGPAAAVSIGVPGQNAQHTFSATSGQAITVRVANSTVGCLSVTLHRPDGAWVHGVNVCGATGTLSHTPTATGTYTIKSDPSEANTGTFDLSVTNP